MSLNVTDFFDDWNKSHTSSPSFQDAIDWAREELICKACDWLKENIEGGVHPQNAYTFVDKFRKAMEE